MFPSFIGIGVRRAGSTWLWELMMDHPDAFVPEHFREVDFFSVESNYAKGLPWYESLFPGAESSSRYAAIGEISPACFGAAKAAERIRAVSSINRLIAILRNPVDRTVSGYMWRKRNYGYGGSILDFIRDHPDSVQGSLYHGSLTKYQSLFSSDELLILIFEEVFSDVVAARVRIAEHVGLDPERFPADAGTQRVNAGGIPSRVHLYRFMVHTAKLMRRWGMYRTVHTLGRTLGLKKLAEGGPMTKVKVPQEHRVELYGIFRDDIVRLEETLHRPLDHWHLKAAK